ncbi:uncharacterized protein LOC104937636 isoform X1 [Larimichthys crocea]|uniref:uncharacterized protein LOC104937636 isoform X1 n=2 Tax=Larimichthys crocea TaxID=215358 RepID=UPI000900DC54|nr:uncharacterized protein LOC104937636 isoform X1 [Larimichthys crocea]
MAEEGSACDLEALDKQLQSLSNRYTGDELRADGEPFCSDFCKLVEEYASRWQVPLPQLRILETALRYFAQASTFFASNCDHVLHTLSSLALSVFELLLFFDQKDLHQEPLKHFTVTFQECHLALARHQNVHLLQVERLVRGGGPWACPALQAILSESSLPQSEVDGCITSELPVFFELRVRYLLSCERVSEAMALAKCCAWHPTAGQHLFFLQVYLTWLFKTSQHDRLHEEVADFSGKDAIHIICSLECEEKDELLLALSRAFLSQQLCKGDMYYLCDLVFVWSKLYCRLKTSKKALLEEIHQLMLSSTNVNSIFPFIRAVLQELGEDGIQFCVELCANALESCLSCDVITKSLIYKTIAVLLPNDLEVCRACALLVFFLERTVEAYKIVYLLYMHPDQEYHVEYSPIPNHIRFETLQVLKKDLYFDPEFWNLIALRTNCLKLMSEKGVSAALEEIMEDKWILNYCTKEPAFRSSTSVHQGGSQGALQTAATKRHHKEDTDTASKRLRMGPGKTRLNDHAVKKKGKYGSSEPLRRSFWQLDRVKDKVAVGYGELRRTTRLSEKNPPKRRIRTPKWLLEDSGTLGENNVSPKIKKHGLKHQKHHRPSVEKRSETGHIKNNAKQSSVNSHLLASENDSKHQKGFSLDCVQPSNPPQVILELSLPDNELLGTFIEDTCNRQRGFPQVLLYKPTVKFPATSSPAKTVHRKEVILRARDAAMFAQQLHCYARRQKGKGNVSNIQGSVSTITRSSVQGSPPKDPQIELCEKPAAEMEGGITSQTPPSAEVTEFPVSEKVLKAPSAKAVSRKTSSARELSEKSAVKMKVTASQATASPVLDKVLQAQTRQLCEESAVEMKVTIASQTPTVGKVSQSSGLDKVSKAQTVKDSSKTTSSVDASQTSDNNHMVVTKEVSNTPNFSNTEATGPMPSQSQDVLRDVKQTELNSLSSQAEAVAPEVLTNVSNSISRLQQVEVPGGTTVTTCTPTDQDSINDISALTLVTEMVTELAPGTFAHRQPENSASKDSRAGSKPKVPHKLHTTSSCSVPGLGVSADADVQMEDEETWDIVPETSENSEPVESEESKLEFCCTFCNKVFKGSRVVAHAMFHYRKDECMFCGTMFKDDLLAMMHLSDHIEKLKKISKESAGNSAQEYMVSETKDTSTHKPPAKAKATNMSPEYRSSGRSRKTSVCLQASSPLGSRKLRSNDKPVNGPSLQEKKQNASKHLNSKTPNMVNGHIGKKKELNRPKSSESKQPCRLSPSDGAEHPRLQENQNIGMDSATSVQADKKFSCSTDYKIKKTESLQVQKKATKQDGKVTEQKNVELQEKVCCPVNGCAWSTDLSKNRVALLYHALEDHYGEIKPLQLAFRIGNRKCCICMRVLRSFEHFQHHVERHRLTPRHPCLHQGCTARFKSGIEMRRHTRKHNPLQAACCLPGCSQLFICLWALNLHERDHYSSKTPKPAKNTNESTGDKHNTPAGKKQPDHNTKYETATTAVNKTESVKATRKSKGQTTLNSSIGKHVKAPSSTTVRASLLKQKLKESKETKNLHVLKNLSNKDTSTEPATPNLRLRHTLRKVTNARSLKSHRVISSSLRHNAKMSHKFKKKQVQVNAKGPKRRGRPPKSKKAVHDENTTTGQNNETVKEKTDQRNPTKLAETSNVNNELKQLDKSQHVQDVVKTTEASVDESKSKKSINKQIKKGHVKQNASTPIVTHSSLNQSVTTDKTQKVHEARKRAASSDSSKSKKHKVANGKVNTELKKKCPESALKNPAQSDSVPTVPANSLNEINASPTTSGTKTHTVATAEKSHVTTKEGKKDSSKANKHKDKTGDRKTVKEKQPCTTSLKKTAKSKSVKQQVEAKTTAAEGSPDVQGKAKEESSIATPDTSGSSFPTSTASGLNEMTSPPSATEENVQKVTKKEKSKKPHVAKNSDPNKANKKRKVDKEGHTKTVKKKSKDPGVSKKPAESKTEVQPLAEVVESSVVEEVKTSVETPQPKMSSPGYIVIMNGKAPTEEVKSTVCKDTLAEYGKKPYLRPPPTAYLDEKYITMPKRRKMCSARSPPPEQVKVTTAPQRQRCANCFATFNSAEDLQSHLQMQKCLNIFGFDSDDEGNS